MKGIFKFIFRAIISFSIAFIIVNILCMAYFRYPRKYFRDTNATDSIYEPYSWISTLYEGAGISYVDDHGYLNKESKLSDKYVIVLGSSHTQGKEVKYSEKYTTLLNDSFSPNQEGCLAVVNMGWDGHFLDEIVAGFGSAVLEYPNTQAVVIELSRLDINYDNKLVERKYSENDVGYNAIYKGNFKQDIKYWFPYLFLLYGKQMESFDFFGKIERSAFNTNMIDDDLDDNYSSNDDEYYSRLREYFSILRKNYKGSIIIVYHPSSEFNEFGEFVVNSDRRSKGFNEICKEFDIKYINTEDEFISLYKNEKKVPYGFLNTSLNTGHLNRYGHRIMFEVLSRELKEVFE